MSVTTFFDKISGLQRKRERQKSERYADIVAAIAAGTEPEAEVVDEVLDGADKSVDDLKVDVERRRNRLALKALAESLPRFEKEGDDLQRKLKWPSPLELVHFE